jgi:hypothetical protein
MASCAPERHISLPMKRHLKPLRAAWLLAALAAVGCGIDVTDPGAENPMEIKLDFCSNETPVWFAYQQSGGAWTSVTPDAAGTFTFNATNRTAIAFVRQNGADYKTDVVFTTNLDLDKLSGLACVEESGAKSINGSVSGVSGSQLALVSMSFASAYLTSNQTTFTLTQLVDRPLDLIASRIDVSLTEQHANKTVIRRAQSQVNGSTMPVINFDAEGVVPTTATATLSGVGDPESGLLMNNFFSNLETSHTLTAVDPISDGPTPFAAIPASAQSAGDYHDLFIVAASADGGARGYEQFFASPANQGLNLGPPLAEPLVTVITSTPNVLLRVLLAGQVEYSTVIMSDFHQETSFANVDVSMFVTASYFGGTPSTWDLPIPSFSGVSGYQDSWALKAGNIEYTITALYGRPQLLLGAKPEPPEFVQFASRTSSMAASQLGIGSAVARDTPPGRAARRPTVFTRLR